MSVLVKRIIINHIITLSGALKFQNGGRASESTQRQRDFSVSWGKLVDRNIVYVLNAKNVNEISQCNAYQASSMCLETSDFFFSIASCVNFEACRSSGLFDRLPGLVLRSNAPPLPQR